MLRGCVGALQPNGIASNFSFLASLLPASPPGMVVLGVAHDLHEQEELDVEVKGDDD